MRGDKEDTTGDAEGIAEPAAFVSDLGGFSDEEVRKVMRENGLALSIPRPA